jgi:hypothetical protein
MNKQKSQFIAIFVCSFFSSIPKTHLSIPQTDGYPGQLQGLSDKQTVISVAATNGIA